ncbi:MAG TPA: MMPL family transporter [Streptosporangiaceae bacterium]|jgi:RND superfamily putative drug exporter|nr:MMPL family transporter [Streptosporangiaceae bacterium]
MTALTRFVLRHKALVVLFWLAVTAAGIMTVSATTHRMTNSFAMPGPAFRTDSQIVGLYGNGGSQAPYVPVLTAPAGQHADSPTATAAAGRAFAAAAKAVPGARVADYASTGDRTFLTRDGRSTYALVFTPPADPMTGGNAGQALTRALAAAAPPGWHASVTGEQLLANGAPAKSHGQGLMAEAMLGAGGSLIVLLVLFASFLALLPLLIGGVSVLATFLIVGGLTEITGISQIVEFLIALIGLGVAIDYSLLVVTRWREERAAGRDNDAAVAAAMAQAGRSVVFSGLTVGIGLLSMIVLPVPMLRSVGFAGVLVPLVSVVVAITLLPVILATAGPRLDWPRLRTERSASRLFSAWARGVYRHRWPAALAGLGILALLALPALSLHLGEPGGTAQATAGPAHDALVTLTRGGVPAGVLTPAEVLVHAGRGQPGRVAAAAAHIPGARAVLAPATADYRRAGTAIVTVIPAAESTTPAGQAMMAQLADRLDGTPGVIGTGGAGLSLIDFDHAVYGNFPLMLAVISAATFLLLTRAFRSAVLAAKAVLFNLVSLAAAFGVLTWVWQDGHGSQAVFGVPATGSITSWVPLMVFAFLFGLSMDYEVFILTRIREEYDATGDTGRAVTVGLGRTGRLVTGAAAILMLSFLSMSTGPQTDLKILATGLGAGLIIDAIVIRCLLVPAMVALFGRFNWWLPAPLARVLRVTDSPVRPLRPAAPEEEAVREPAGVLLNSR